MTREVLVYGAGGFAREVVWLLEQVENAGGDFKPVGYIDDSETDPSKLLNGLPVFGLAAAVAKWPSAGCVVGVGDPSTRARLYSRASDAGLIPVTVIHPRVERSKWVEIGLGTVICAGTILTTNIRLGRGVQINLDCTIGHDVTFGDFATLAPGVHVSGWVSIGAGAYIGTGASIINGREGQPVVIGDGAVVGAGACVTRSVDPGVTVVGVPAKPRS